MRDIGKSQGTSIKIPEEYKQRLRKLNSQFSLLLHRTRKDFEKQDAVKEIKAAYRKLKFRLAKILLKGFFKFLWQL